MLVKKIKFKDYNGVDREKDYYFNLNKGEIFNLQYGKVKGGLLEYMKELSKEQDTPKMVELLEDLILSAYGEKSPDGEYFWKGPDPVTHIRPRDKFKQSEAFSELLMELLTDEKKTADFFNALVPADLMDQVEAMEIEGDGGLNVIGNNN